MSADHVVADAGTLRRRLLAVEPGRRRRAVMLRHLTEQTAQVLGEPAAALDTTAPLTSLGLTSAQLVDLRGRLEATLGVPLPATLAWQCPTLEALAPYLAERLGIDLDAAAPRPAAAPAGETPEAAPATETPDVVALDDLSDGDLATLLLATLDEVDLTDGAAGS
jgi:acyl carrier protein